MFVDIDQCCRHVQGPGHFRYRPFLHDVQVEHLKLFRFDLRFYPGDGRIPESLLPLCFPSCIEVKTLGISEPFDCGSAGCLI